MPVDVGSSCSARPTGLCRGPGEERQGRACAQEELTARREAQLPVCARRQRSVPRRGGAGEGEGSRQRGGRLPRGVMCELGLTESVSVDDNNSVLVVIVVSAS